MSSLTKQLKRAKRAKTKAKQQRTARSAPPSQLDSFQDGPSAYPHEFFEVMFTQLQQAENESRKELFVTACIAVTDVLLGEQGLQQALSKSDDPAETMAALIQFFLIDYRMWAYGATEEETLEWLDTPDVLADLAQAMDEAAAELATELPEDNESSL